MANKIIGSIIAGLIVSALTGSYGEGSVLGIIIALISLFVG